MRKLVKDSEDNVMVLNSVNGFIPDGYTLVADEDIDAAEIVIARARKMVEIRAKRDYMLVENDKQWLIASKKAESTTTLEADAVILRDMTDDAQTAIDAESDLQTVKDYDAFASITLAGTYE